MMPSFLRNAPARGRIRCFLGCVLACALPAFFSFAHARETFDFDWRFARGDPPGAAQTAFDDGAWRAVSLPHDWSIEGPYGEDEPAGGPGGYLPTGTGWYRKTFRLPESAKGKKITVQFDGIYMNATVWLNGRELGTQPYGYTAFEHDLTPHLVFGGRENTIAVRVDNSRQPNSRWYSGSGIYRHVWLRVTEPLHIPTWGVCVTTPEISGERALVRARVSVRNDGGAPRAARVSLAVLDASGATVAEGAAGDAAEIAAGGAREFSGEVTLPRPLRWSPETPHLYRLRATVSAAEGRSPGGSGDDFLDTTFGVRSIEFDAARGFILNGQKTIMRGMCLHHDGGAVGAAVPDAVLRRRLLLLKEMGCNAVRASHNPMAPEFYDLCDELGLLVMDEIFDEWTGRKPQIQFGYSDFYQEWHERDLVAFVRRNRNHPGIVIWSAGNEIGEQGSAKGADVLRPLVELFHREDPTRPVTAALDRAYTERGHAPAAFTDLLDVVGYNYVDRWGTRRETHYADDRALFPRRQFIGTENTSARGERGHYPFGPLLFDSARRGDASAANPPQGALYPAATLRAQALWKFVATHDYVAGDFAWTGFDYLGESRWPRKQSTSGALDTCGFKKDAFYFYQSIWTTKPMIHLLPHWNWPGREGRIIPVLAFTNGRFAELFLNGRSLGVKAKEFPRQGSSGGWNAYARPVVQSMTTDLHFAWDVPYEPGELRAVVYDDAGAIIAEDRVRTAGAPAALELRVDRPEIAADARDVAHITVRALDANGVFVPLADDEVLFEISGPGKLIGVDNGDPASHASYQGRARALHAGMALALVQSETTPGTVKIAARSKTMGDASVEVVTRAK
ncbi:MAG: DUF4982 domain-containing protein [Opitutaceae bacterium]|nr:DUF4982 domain-containing protein [Opitutaceae bacterium]